MVRTRAWCRLSVAVVLLTSAVPACTNAGGGDRAADVAGGSEAAPTKVELLRSDGEDFRRTVIAYTADEGRSICIDVTQRRGDGGGCNPVRDESLYVGDDATGGLIFGYVTGHPEVVEVRVAGGGREVILPLREEALRPPPVHEFSREPMTLRFFAAADPVAFNEYSVTALDGAGNTIEVPATSD